jgi:hypothetical protein
VEDARSRRDVSAQEDASEELPFWLDYLLPVGSGGVFLLVVWLLALLILWQQ